jgi:hypothetical protein
VLNLTLVIVVGRNPKDVAVSNFFHNVNFNLTYGIVGSFPEYARFFREGKLISGNYWNHLKVSLVFTASIMGLRVSFSEENIDWCYCDMSLVKLF